MRSIIQRILDTVRPYSGRPIVATKGDRGLRYINATICTDGSPHKIPTSCVAKIKYQREFNAALSEDSCEIGADGTVTIRISDWALAEDGLLWCRISVESGGNEIKTARFPMIVVGDDEVDPDSSGGVEDGGTSGGTGGEGDPEDPVAVYTVYCGSSYVTESSKDDPIQAGAVSKLSKFNVSAYIKTFNTNFTMGQNRFLVAFPSEFANNIEIIDKTPGFSFTIVEGNMEGYNLIRYPEELQIGGMSYKVYTYTVAVHDSNTPMEIKFK